MMALRARLLELLDDHGVRVDGAVRRALADLLAVVRAENEEADEADADDVDDEVATADGGADPLVTRVLTCPHCGERLEIAIDLSGGDQDQVQDCEVCCSPIRIVTRVRAGRLVDLASEPA